MVIFSLASVEVQHMAFVTPLQERLLLIYQPRKSQFSHWVWFPEETDSNIIFRLWEGSVRVQWASPPPPPHTGHLTGAGQELWLLNHKFQVHMVPDSFLWPPGHPPCWAWQSSDYWMGTIFQRPKHCGGKQTGDFLKRRSYLMEWTFYWSLRQ